MTPEGLRYLQNTPLPPRPLRQPHGPVNPDAMIFMQHGDMDRLVPLSFEEALQHFHASSRPNKPKSIHTLSNFTLLQCTKIKDAECPICYELYDDTHHVAVKLNGVACQHVFGKVCLEKWLKSGMPNVTLCPSCRRDILPALSFAAPPLPPSIYDVNTRPGTTAPMPLP